MAKFNEVMNNKGMKLVSIPKFEKETHIYFKACSITCSEGKMNMNAFQIMNHFENFLERNMPTNTPMLMAISSLSLIHNLLQALS